MLSLLYFLAFRFKSYNVCAVNPIYDYYTLQLCRTAAQHFEANFSMSNWPIGPRKQVKRGKQCLVGRFCQWHSYWRRLAIKFSHEPRRSFCKLADIRIRGRLTSIWIRIVNTCGRGKFWIRKEKFADSKISVFVHTGKGLSHRDTNFFRPEQHQQQCLLFSALGTNALCTIKRQIP